MIWRDEFKAANGNLDPGINSADALNTEIRVSSVAGGNYVIKVYVTFGNTYTAEAKGEVQGGNSAEEALRRLVAALKLSHKF